MQTFLVILLVLAMIGAVVALVRGVVIFLRTNHENVMSGGVSQSGLKQNRMMQARVLFQALAILIVVLLLMLRAAH